MTLTADDIGEAEFSNSAYWHPTMQLRFYRPKGGNDTDVRLEQLWERVTGERHWRPVQTLFAD